MVFQVIWTAHLRQMGSGHRGIDATLNNADHLPDPDPDTRLMRIGGQPVLLTDRSGNLVVMTRQNLVFLGRTHLTLLQAYVWLRALIYEHIAGDVTMRKKAGLIRELCERNDELHELMLWELIFVFSQEFADVPWLYVPNESAHTVSSSETVWVALLAALTTQKPLVAWELHTVCASGQGEVLAWGNCGHLVR